MTHIRSIVLSLTALIGLAVPMAQAADVRLFVLAPQPPTSLKTVEMQGSDKPAYSHSYAIPYGTLEQQLRTAVKSKANLDTGEQIEPCPSACPDVHWRVVVNSDVTFTQKPQPAIKAFGNAQENGIDVTLQHAQVKLHLDVHAEIWIKPVTGTISKSVDVPIDLLIGLDAASKLNLWPAIISAKVPCAVTQAQETVCVTLTLDGKNIDLSDAKGAVVGVGAALGGLIGATQFGALLGDPLGSLLSGNLGSKIAALGSQAAADKAESYIQGKANEALNAMMQVASVQATVLASNYLDARVTQINTLKDTLLNTKLPQINKSYQELANAFGLSFDVQTRISNADMYVIVTPRFAANPAGSKLIGKLRMPKEACVYGEWKMGTIPLGLTTVKNNLDLAGKVGTSCANLMPSSDVKLAGYLGADPKILKVGANPLPNWQPVGSFKLTGTLSEYKHGTALQTQMRRTGGSTRHAATGYYECGFEISGLPGADIIELVFKGKAAERMPGYQQDPHRLVAVSAAGASAALDADWKSAGPPVVIGGEGKCTAGKVKAPHYEPQSWLDRITDLLDIDKCPNCDIKLSEDMLKAANMKPILENPALKPLFDALETGKPLPAATKMPATQAPATQQAPAAGGVQHAPALRPQLQRPGLQKGVETPK